MIPTAIVAYLALFATVGFLFVLACLVLGKVLRSHAPTPQKTETYECGEPAVGPGSVQFDLRFYVVALVFLIFEVEVAFFFPPATVFGQATRLLAAEATGETPGPTTLQQVESPSQGALAETAVVSPRSARTLAIASMVDLAIFFAVLLVGFAYVWSRGDLDWVRAVGHPTATAEPVATMVRLRSEA
jgi:NADH-quinone oxidoreductase subunit A